MGQPQGKHRKDEGRVSHTPRLRPKPPSAPQERGPAPIPEGNRDSQKLFTAKPPLIGKASSKQLMSQSFTDKDLSNPFGPLALIAQNEGWGQQGGIGFTCYNCRALILGRERAVLNQEPLHRCPNCQKVSASLVAARISPIQPSHAKWMPYATVDHCYHWIRVLNSDEEEGLKKEINDLLALEQSELEEMISKMDVELDSLKSKYEDAVKEELAQYVIVYRMWDPRVRAEDGYIRERLRSGTVFWTRVGKYREDPTEWKDRLVHAETLVQVSQLPLAKRLKWLRNNLDALRYVDPYEGPMRVFVNRESLLEDASNWILALKDRDKWRTCRYEFHNEPAMDSGGVAKEWYRLVCDSCFQPGYGLFERIDLDDVTYSFNPASGLYNPERHLYYFRFAGRILAKAIFEGCFVEAHLSKVVYKHIIGRPCSFEDLKYIDSNIYRSFSAMLEDPEIIEELFLTFSYTSTDSLGTTTTIELKPGGEEIDVTKENVSEYIKLYIKHVMYDRISVQLDHFLNGFHEIIPQPLLSVLDHEEFEALMCGVSKVDVDDWRKNVTYRGEFKDTGEDHQVIQWFWEVVSEFESQDRSKLLQYITGSSRVPMSGFKGFEEGDSLLISIESISPEESVFPRAHTCFNRLELPLYTDKEELRKRVSEAMQLQNGFNLE